MALASLLLSFTGVVCFIGPLVAIPLGISAFVEIKQTGEDGYGLALTGVMISIASLIVGTVMLLVFLRTR